MKLQDLGSRQLLPNAFQILVVSSFLFSATVYASVPGFISYSGRLTDETGWGQSTVMRLTFSIYDSEIGGTRLWTQDFPSPPGVVVVDGYFSVVLGDGQDAVGDPLNITNVFQSHEQAWIAVAVNGGSDVDQDSHTQKGKKFI